MSSATEKRGAAPVGYITELDSIEAASVIYFRLWSTGLEGQESVWNDFITSLGPIQGGRALQAFEEICKLCAHTGRRPLMRHSVNCKCLGSDEACFANFIASAAEGKREDAMFIATLMARPDLAPILAGHAAEFGLALKRMNLCAPRHLKMDMPNTRAGTETLH